MKTEKPICQTLRPWLRANLGDHCLGVLTGTDARALAAAVHVIDLIRYDDRPELYPAFAAIVRQMQPTARPLAFHAIAHVLDWPDRESIWKAAGLDPIKVGRCAHE